MVSLLCIEIVFFDCNGPGMGRQQKPGLPDHGACTHAPKNAPGILASRRCQERIAMAPYFSVSDRLGVATAQQLQQKTL